MVADGVFNAGGHAHLCGEMENQFAAFHRSFTRGLIEHVSLDNVGCGMEVGDGAAAEIIKHADIGAKGHEGVNDVAANEACPAGDEARPPAKSAAVQGVPVELESGMGHGRLL